ncbi:MAG: stage V sporulation protein AD [Lachnospiraceae bacterium]|nr:stage V sporulation protein AD [Lachnospiraceae bacterium]
MNVSGHKGRQSILFDNNPIVTGWASVAGKMEGEGPLGRYYDVISDSPEYGGKNWEEAESRMQMTAVRKAVEKTDISMKDIEYIVAGDLLGQLIASSFGIKSFNIPVFGVYGACSTMGESLSIASILISGGFAENVVAVTSSHYATAEKQFRFPVSYGNQRPQSATTTVTGSGAVVLSVDKPGRINRKPHVCVKGITTGMIMDYGITDANNMGAAMAPAACNVIENNLNDFGINACEYDRIITGDLGSVGSRALLDMLHLKGINISDKHMDCGSIIYDNKKQDVHSGGSGCGCSAITLCGYIMNQMLSGEWRKVLFIPTGALLSPVSSHEGNTIPGIAHGIVLERV